MINNRLIGNIVCSFVWCLTARQHRIGQFVPTAGVWNRRSWLRMANETQCIIINTSHNVTQFTRKHSSYKNATTGYLIVWLACLNITLAPSPIPSRYHTLLIRYNNFTRWDAVLRHAQDIVHTFAHSTRPWQKKWILSNLFPVYWFWATVCASTRDNRYITDAKYNSL